MRPRGVSEQEATRIVKEIIAKYIQEDKYVDAFQIENGLRAAGNFVGMSRLTVIQDVQRINVFVDSCIDSYQYTHHIRIFCDLEAVILEMYKKMVQDHAGRYTSFESIGVGSLVRHPKIVKLFGFDDERIIPSHLPQVTVKDVIEVTLEFMDRNKSGPRENGNLQKEFDQHMRSKLSQRYRCHSTATGVQVDYTHSLYHKLIKLKHRESKAVEEFSLEYVVEIAQKLRSTFDNTISKPRLAACSTMADKPALKLRGGFSIFPDFPNLFEIVEHISSIIAVNPVSPTVSFTDFVEHVSHHFQLKCSHLNDLEFFKVVNEGFDVRPLAFQQVTIGGNEFDLKALYSSITLLLSVLVAAARDDNSPLSNIVDGGNLHHLLSLQLVADFPKSVIDNLFYVLESLAVDIVVSRQSAGKSSFKAFKDASFNFDNVSRRLESNISLATRKKTASTRFDYLAAATAATVILLRTKQIEMMELVDEVQTSSMLCTIDDRTRNCCDQVMKASNVDFIAGETAATDFTAPFRWASLQLLVVLSSVEDEILNSKNLPAFECYRKGTFMKYLVNCHADLVTEVHNCLVQHYFDGRGLKVAEVTPLLVNSSDMAAEGSLMVRSVLCADPKYSEQFLDIQIDEIIEEIMVYTEQSVPDILRLLHIVEKTLLSNLDDGSGVFACVSGGKSFLHYLTESVGRGALSRFQQLTWEGSSKACSLSVEGDCRNLPSSDFAISDLLAELVAQACLRNNGFRSWGSRDEFVAEVAAHLAAYFNCHLSATSRLATVVVQSFLEKHWLVTASTQDGTLQLNLQSDTACLHDGHHVIIDAGILGPRRFVEGRSCVDAVAAAVRLILMTPYGESCKEFCGWDHFERELVTIHTEERQKISVVDFVTNYCADTSSRKAFYFAVLVDDCIPLPLEAPSARDVRLAFVGKDFQLIAAWLLASKQTNCANYRELMEYIRLEFLNIRQENGVAAIDVLLDTSLRIMCSIHSAVHHVVLLELAEIIGTVMGNISVVTIFTCPAFAGLFVRSRYTCYLRRIAEIYGTQREFTALRQVAAASASSAAHWFPGRDSGGSQQRELSVTAPLVTQVNIPPADQVQCEATHTEVKLGGYLKIVEAGGENINTPHNIEAREYINDLLTTRFSQSKDSAFGVMLQNSLNKLSEDLYSSDVHFVSELVQNADDNVYECDVPSLNMVLYPKVLEVYNNEVGFSRENINAIANISASTKVNKSGFIGQKGIG
jgi:hypothetical protein